MTGAPKAVMDIASLHEAFRGIVDALIDEWEPEGVPINTAMSALGRAFVENASPSPEDATRVFGQVDAILQHGTSAEKDAVTTGFLEALVSAIDRKPEQRWLLDAAGPEARAYVDEWNRFCGVRN